MSEDEPSPEQGTEPAVESGPSKVTCYSGGEAEFMVWSQEMRAQLLEPLLRGMARLGVTANQITLLALLCGLAFAPVFRWGTPLAAFILLLVHVLLDGLDGPLARFRGTASSRGSLTDTMADQLVVTVVTVTMISAGHASLWPGVLYIFFYLLVVTFAFVRNALLEPYSWLFRPRFLVFLWLPLEVYLWPGTLDWVLWGAVAILALKTATGFRVIRRRM